MPIIDIGALSGEDQAAKKAVAEKIGKACEEIGFFVVVNHGIPKEVIDKTWNQTLDFFDLPLEEKKTFVSEDEAKNPYGASEILELFSDSNRSEVFGTLELIDKCYVALCWCN